MFGWFCNQSVDTLYLYDQGEIECTDDLFKSIISVDLRLNKMSSCSGQCNPPQLNILAKHIFVNILREFKFFINEFKINLKYN